MPFMSGLLYTYPTNFIANDYNSVIVRLGIVSLKGHCQLFSVRTLLVYKGHSH